MTLTAQRLAIAKLDGFSDFVNKNEWEEDGDCEGFRDVLRGNRGGRMDVRVPDYPSDLAAMRTVILAQDPHVQWGTFTELARIVGAHTPAYLGSSLEWSEAFLRFLQLWDDAK